jgi:enoyl-CoA hydratase
MRVSDILPGEIRLERDGAVAIVTIDRPTKLNTMTVAMDTRMNELIFEINQDQGVRAVVLTGAGDRAFSAGSDVNDLGEYGSNWQYRNRFEARRDYAQGGVAVPKAHSGCNPWVLHRRRPRDGLR